MRTNPHLPLSPTPIVAAAWMGVCPSVRHPCVSVPTYADPCDYDGRYDVLDEDGTYLVTVEVDRDLYQ